MYGRAGIGKSSIVNSLGKKVFDVRAVLIDIGDLVTKVPDIETKTLMNYYCETFKEIIRTAKNQDVILLLDEFTQATIPVLRMFYQIILDRRLENLSIPDNVQIIAVSNTAEDLEATDLIAEKPLWDRFNFRVKLRTNINDWTEWALNNRIDHRIISFLNSKQTYLHYDKGDELKTTPRRWEFVNKIMENESELQILSVLGNEVGTMFNANNKIIGKFDIKHLLKNGISELTEDEKYMVIPLLSHELSKKYKPQNYDEMGNNIETVTKSLIADQNVLLVRFLINEITAETKGNRDEVKMEMFENIPITLKLLRELNERNYK